MGPERSGNLSKMAQHASNQARAELRSLDFCPRQTVILCSYPTKGKECFSLASPLSLAWKARQMSHSPSAAFKLGSVFWNAYPFSCLLDHKSQRDCDLSSSLRREAHSSPLPSSSSRPDSPKELLTPTAPQSSMSWLVATLVQRNPNKEPGARVGQGFRWKDVGCLLSGWIASISPPPRRPAGRKSRNAL